MSWVRRVRFGLLSVLLLCSLGSTAGAEETYIYTGNAFTIANPPYTMSDSVTMTLTLRGPLEPNLSDVFINQRILAFELFDGVDTVDNTNANFFAARINTDSEGRIVDWGVLGEKPGRAIGTCNTNGSLTSFSGNIAVAGCNGIIDDETDGTTNAAGNFANNQDVAGVWTQATTYRYNGNPFTFVQGPYTTFDFVSITMTLRQPLPPNASDFAANTEILTFSATDGVIVVDGSNSTFLSARFDTDENGIPTEWAFDARISGSDLVRTCQFGAGFLFGCADGIDDEGRSGGDTASNLSSPGVWEITSFVDLVPVGDPGNACEQLSSGCFGGVDQAFQIGKFEITNAQYAEFLNAVAATDTNDLYDTSMGTNDVSGGTIWVGGITRAGTSGFFVYTPIAGKEEWPVNYLTFWDAVRFANWLHNGRPSGVQDDTTTEDGAYTLTPEAISNNTVTRNPGAQFFLPTEDEWYKAAFYNPGTMTYLDYPASSNAETSCTTPGTTPNTANCFSAVSNGLLTDVGSYVASASPYGTFDQGGNLNEWNETSFGSQRGYRGGQKEIFPTLLAADVSTTFRVRSPGLEGDALNLASVRIAAPEPGAGALGAAALLSLVALRRRKEERARLS